METSSPVSDADATRESGAAGADALSAILMADDVAAALWSAVDSGRIDDLVPELPLLRMEQDPIHRHKEVLSHTIAVVAKTPADLIVRLAALFHDIAKPRTRSFEHGGVTFRHHEVVGARMTRARMTSLGYDEEIVDEVSELVRLSGRFKGYTEGWSDSAVRRYARDAGPLLGRLNALIRSDCTTRNKQKEADLQAAIDDLEARIAGLAEEDRRAAERPQIDGQAVMAHLDTPGGRHIGQILEMLLEVKRAEGDLPEEELYRRVDLWWEKHRDEYDSPR
jgi:poly(A) polymerase